MNYFDLPQKDKDKIINKAVKKTNQEQRELVNKYMKDINKDKKYTINH